MYIWETCEAMQRDESTHAFTMPDDTCLRMLLSNETSEGSQIIDPVFPGLNVSTAGGHGVIALSTELRSIDSSSLHGLLEMGAKILEVLRSAGYAVKPNYDYGWFRAIQWEPFSKWEMRMVERRVGLSGEMGIC
tara:strand:- start:139 stop:540 length:402 start_codon:yes stop_codon:yes gene_type:complete